MDKELLDNLARARHATGRLEQLVSESDQKTRDQAALVRAIDKIGNPSAVAMQEGGRYGTLADHA